MIEASWIAFAFALGLLARFIGLPPLIGYLGAGFALAAAGDYVGVTRDDSIILDHLSHLGVLLLLFTVGLKLKLGNLVRREVIGGSLLHFLISSVLVLPAIMLILDSDWREAMLLAIALSFSSTVLAAKVLESKRELRAFPWPRRHRRADHPGPHRPGGNEPGSRQDAVRLGVAGVSPAAAAAGAVPPARSQRPRGADGAARPDAGAGRRRARLRVRGLEFRTGCPGLRRHARQAQACRRAVQLVVGDQGSVPGGLLPQDRHRRPAGRRRPLVRLRHGLAAAAQGGAVLRAVHRLPSARAQRLSAPPA